MDHSLADCDLQSTGHLIGARDQLAIVAAFLEQLLRMRFLKITRADLRRWNLRGDREDGHARPVAIEQTIDEVQVAGPAAASANGEFAGKLRFGAGRESGDFLVAHMHPFDLTLSTQRVSQAV